MTGTIGYGITSSKKTTSPIVDPDTGMTTLAVDHHSNTINYGFAIEYSNFYLRANVHDFGLPEWVNRLTPLVEFSFVTPVTDRYGEKTVGTINPGIIWSGQHMQFSVEAIIPVTQATGKNVGIIAQLHFYLDDIFSPNHWSPALRILSDAASLPVSRGDGRGRHVRGRGGRSRLPEPGGPTGRRHGGTAERGPFDLQ
jgi:hypothetical protein